MTDDDIMRRMKMAGEKFDASVKAASAHHERTLQVAMLEVEASINAAWTRYAEEMREIGIEINGRNLCTHGNQTNDGVPTFTPRRD